VNGDASAGSDGGNGSEETDRGRAFDLGIIAAHRSLDEGDDAHARAAERTYRSQAIRDWPLPGETTGSQVGPRLSRPMQSHGGA
jgi:hypothetical protein